jgi:hypothetical protein
MVTRLEPPKCEPAHNSAYIVAARMDKPLGPISEIRKAMSVDVLEESYLAGALRSLYSLVMFGSFRIPLGLRKIADR